MRAALLQLTASDDPGNNLRITSELLRHAVKEGADLVLTPEVTNCVSLDRGHQAKVLKTQEEDA
ncbi:MAG TPA: carbon-nitrogen hydrolase family protein, partial [Paracoccaceae bacterium]|nr:carbon-nitrogen hydrolase family protein [Paracoccaceae bacterium]